MNRVLALALNTFREAARNKILYSLLFFAILLILSALALGQLSLNEEVRMVRDVGLFGIDVFGVVIAIFVGINLLYKELDLKTVYTILPKPIHRWEFVLGKWLGMLITLVIQVVVMGAVLMVTLLTQGGEPSVAMVKALWLIYVNVVVVTSIAVFFSAFSSPFLSGFFTFGVFFVGRSADDLRLFGAKAGGFIKTLSEVVATIVPNLHLYVPSATVVDEQRVSVHADFVTAAYMLNATAYGLAYSLFVLVAAMAIFRRRDFI